MPELPRPNPYRVMWPERRDTPTCPECGRSVDEAEWEFLSSPPETWRELAGREGWLGRCPEHGAQIAFVITTMN